MTAFAIFTAIVWVAGLVVGATVGRDWLDAVPRRGPARQTIPLATVVSSPTDWKRLDLPPCRRPQYMRVIDV